MQMHAVNQHVHQMKDAMTAGAYIATMNLAITMIGNVYKSQNTAQKDAAVKYLNIMKYNVADMFHNTIVKHAAVMNQNIMMYKNAQHATNGYVAKNANMFHATTTNTFAVMTAKLDAMLKEAITT